MLARHAIATRPQPIYKQPKHAEQTFPKAFLAHISAVTITHSSSTSEGKHNVPPPATGLADPPIPPEAKMADDDIIDIDYQEEALSSSYSITSFGADFLVDGLVSRLASGDIIIPRFDPETEDETGLPGFQRRFVWRKSQCDKFIESLLMGFPVPGIFLVQQPNNVYLVLDGQQRLATLQDFHDGIFRDRSFKLEYVQDDFRGLTYNDLPSDDRRRLDNSIIHATILKQDDPEDNKHAIYQIFERINTGGTPLQPQEIRIALYDGSLIKLIRKLNSNPCWRELFGKESPRFKDHELILRFLAFYNREDKYRRPMKGFLNDFLADYQNIGSEHLNKWRQVFTSTCAAISEGIGRTAFRPTRSLNTAVADSVMVGIARRLDEREVSDAGSLVPLLKSLLEDPEYKEAIDQRTAGEESVHTRMSKASQIFARAK